MPRPYAPLALANEFILRSGTEGVGHMKLQKLVYCAHGWWLSTHQDSIVSERPEVWRHGPVFSSLYSALAGHGSQPIRSPQRAVFGQTAPRLDDDDADANDLVHFVWDRYGQLSGFRLSELTHKKGTPWQITAEQHNYSVPRHLKIDDDLIRREFQGLASTAAA